MPPKTCSVSDTAAWQHGWLWVKLVCVGSGEAWAFISRASVRAAGVAAAICACPEQCGLVERVIRTLKGQCVHRHRFESLQHASRLIGDWIHFYNHRRPHQALNMRTPAKAFALAA